MMELVRFGLYDDRTMGRLQYEGETYWTVEKPWRNNEAFRSCIPDGFYNLKRVDSPKFGDVWEIADVVGRTHILIHVGNTAHDVVGCVALGSGLQVQAHAVTQSRVAMAKFMDQTKGKDAEEIIIRSGWLS